MGLFADGFKELKKASVPLYKTPKSIQETIEIMKVAENGIGSWTEPKGGYFISFDAMDGCAKAIVAKCKEAGVNVFVSGGYVFKGDIAEKIKTLREALK